MNRLSGYLRGINLLLLAAVGLSSGSLAGKIIESRLLATLPPPQASGPVQPVARTFDSYQEALGANLFQARRSTVVLSGVFPEGSTGEVGDPLPGQGVLPITLSGVLRAGSASFAFVVAANQERAYRMKECLPSQASEPEYGCRPDQGRLVEVKSRGIVVEKGGRYYLFELEGGTMDLNQGAAPAMAGRTNGGGATQFSKVERGNQVQMTVPSVEVDSAFANFSTVLKDSRVLPVVENGLPAGFRIFEIQPGSIYEKLGLRNEDVIKRVNGKELSSVEEAMRLFQTFRNERDIVLEIHRGGAPMQFSYAIR